MTQRHYLIFLMLLAQMLFVSVGRVSAVNDTIDVKTTLKLASKVKDGDHTKEFYYVKGVVATISRLNKVRGTMNIDISQVGSPKTSTYIYRLYSYNNGKFKTVRDICINDTVVVYSHLQKFEREPGLYEGWLVSRRPYKEPEQSGLGWISVGIIVFVVAVLITIVLVYYFRIKMKSSIAESQKYKAELERDFLTGVLNRRGGEHQFGSIISTMTPGFITMIDIDHFKHTNDTFGHAVGDKVLAAVGMALKRCDGHIAMRYGGDEFSLFTSKNCSIDEYKTIIDKLFADISAIEIPELKGEHISISAGTVWYNGVVSVMLNDLLQDADCLMYLSKEKDGNYLTIRNYKRNG